MMLTSLDKLREGFWDYLPLAAIVSVLMVLEMVVILGGKHFGLKHMPAPVAHGPEYSNTKELGRLLYTEYVYPFEIAAVIFLVAIVAAIALTMRRRKNTKYQNPAEQVRVKRADRVRLVSMPADNSAREKTEEKAD